MIVVDEMMMMIATIITSQCIHVSGAESVIMHILIANQHRQFPMDSKALMKAYELE